MIIITIMMIVIKISLIIMLVTVILIMITVLGSVAYHTQNLREKQYLSECIIIMKWFEGWYDD